MNLDIGDGRDENVLWQATSSPLPSSVKNIVVHFGANNV